MTSEQSAQPCFLVTLDSPIVMTCEQSVQQCSIVTPGSCHLHRVALLHTAGHCCSGSECPASEEEEKYLKVGRVEKRVSSHQDGKSRTFWAPRYVKLTRASIRLSLSEDSDTREIIDLLEICVAESVEEEDLDKGLSIRIRSIPSDFADVPEASLQTSSSPDKKDTKDPRDEDRPEMQRSFSKRNPPPRKSALVTTCVVS